MGLFRVRNGNMSVFQSHDFSQPASGPSWVGDHLAAFFRYVDTGSYDRVFDFFALPQQQQLVSLGDLSVTNGGALPDLSGLQWQIGSGFAPIPGPRLTADSPAATRLYAFFAPESWPYDQAIGGHLIGFASFPVTVDGPFALPWTSVWKAAASWNDAESKLARGVPLRTLHLRNFTPVIALRGDGAIVSPNQPGSRHVGGLTGWFDGGYFYLLLSTLLSSNTPNPSCPAYTNSAIGMLLFRVKWDSTRSDSGGLALDAAGRPYVDLYYSDSPSTEKYFHPLPHPDEVVSFADDAKPWNCTGSYRQNFSGCCNNPPVPAGNAMIPGLGSSTEYFIPSSTYSAPSQVGYYTTLSRNASSSNPLLNEPYWARILRIARTGLAAPMYVFSEADAIIHASPNGYYVAGAYQAGMPNIGQLENGTMIGFRTVHNATTHCEGQYAFTVPKNPERSGFYALTPCRLLDTRSPTGPLGGPSISAGESRLFVLSGACGVPTTAKSVSVNFTVVAPGADGSLTAFGGGMPEAQSSTVSFRAGRSVANNAILGVGGLATLRIRNNSGTAVNVALDVNGYFE